MVSVRAGDVRGPVATMTLSHPAYWRGDLLARDRHQRVSLQLCGHRLGEAFAVDGQRPAGRGLVGVAGRAMINEPARRISSVEQADHALYSQSRAEGVGTDQLRQAIGLVGVGAADRAHLVQHHRGASLGDLPGGLAAGQAAADHVNGVQAHGAAFTPPVLRAEVARGRAVLT